MRLEWSLWSKRQQWEEMAYRHHSFWTRIGTQKDPGMLDIFWGKGGAP